WPSRASNRRAVSMPSRSRSATASTPSATRCSSCDLWNVCCTFSELGLTRGLVSTGHGPAATSRACFQGSVDSSSQSVDAGLTTGLGSNAPVFEVRATEGAARTGVLRTAHGEVRTPVFMPVGTKATVKTLHPDEVRALGAQIVLGNTYHLHFRPGSDVIRDLGGLH